MSDERYISLKEAAQILGVGKSTLRNWDRAGKVHTERHPMNNFRIYLKSEIEKLKQMQPADREVKPRKPRVKRKKMALVGEAAKIVQAIRTQASRKENKYQRYAFITMQQAEEVLKVSRDLISRWCEKGDISYFINPETKRIMFNKMVLLRQVQARAKAAAAE